MTAIWRCGFSASIFKICSTSGVTMKRIWRTQDDEFGDGKFCGLERLDDHVFPDGRELVVLVLDVLIVAGVDMERADIVGEHEGEAQALFGDTAPAIYWDEDDGRLDVFEADGRGVIDFGDHAVVVLLDAQHQEDEQRHHHRCDPCALRELGDENDDDGDACGKCTQRR